MDTVKIAASGSLPKVNYKYHIECPFMDGWNAFQKGSRHYCNGYMDAMRGQMPRLHLRLVRSDGKVIDEIQSHDDVGIGMVAGWPTAEQYETAANRALERAEKIRNRNQINQMNTYDRSIKFIADQISNR